MSKQGTIGIEICLDKRTNCWYQSTFKYLSKPFLKRETVSIVCITEGDAKNSISVLNLKRAYRNTNFDQYFSREEFNFQRLSSKDKEERNIAAAASKKADEILDRLERNGHIKNGKLV